MTIVTITEPVTLIKGVINGAIHLDFRWQRTSLFENTVVPAPPLHKQIR